MIYDLRFLVLSRARLSGNAVNSLAMLSGFQTTRPSSTILTITLLNWKEALTPVLKRAT